MTSKERARAAIAREPDDRPWVDYAANAGVDMMLCDHLGRPDGTARDYWGIPNNKGTHSPTAYAPVPPGNAIHPRISGSSRSSTCQNMMEGSCCS